MGGWPPAPDKQGVKGRVVFQRGPTAPATASPSLRVEPDSLWGGVCGTQATDRHGPGKGLPHPELGAGAEGPGRTPTCTTLGRSPLGSVWQQVAQHAPPPRRRPPASQQPRPPEMKTPPRQQAVIRSAHEPLIHYEPRGREIRQKYSASLISGGRKIRVGGFFCFSFLYIDTDIPLWGNVHFPFAELQPVCRHPRPRKTPWVWPPPLTQRASSLLFVLYNINSIFKLHMNTVPHLGGAAACRGKPPHPG